MEALEALNLILKEKLIGNGLWDARGYPMESPASITYPYALWFPSGDTPERQAVHVQTVRMQMSVKGVCGEQDDITDPHGLALTMQSQLSDLLRWSGAQDAGGNSLPVNSEWDVLTVTQGRMIYLRAPLPDTSWSYHAGHVWDILMERK